MSINRVSEEISLLHGIIGASLVIHDDPMSNRYMNCWLEGHRTEPLEYHPDTSHLLMTNRPWSTDGLDVTLEKRCLNMQVAEKGIPISVKHCSNIRKAMLKNANPKEIWNFILIGRIKPLIIQNDYTNGCYQFHSNPEWDRFMMSQWPINLVSGEYSQQAPPVIITSPCISTSR